jgi:hypothetical protein
LEILTKFETHSFFLRYLRPPKKKKKKGFSWKILKELCEATSIFTIGQMEKKIKFKKNCAHFWAGQALFAPINFSALSKSAISAWKRIGWKFLEF